MNFATEPLDWCVSTIDRLAIHPRTLGRTVALGWNVAGLLTLANAITLDALTAPGLNLIHSEVPNIAIGAFPFTYIAGFFAPLAIALHALSIRALRAELRSTPPLSAPAIAT